MTTPKTPSTSGAPGASLAAVSHDLGDAAASAGASLVRIRQRRRRGLSGVVVADGLIVTSARAIGDRDVTAEIGDAVFQLSLVGRDAGTDVALLRVLDGDAGFELAPPPWRRDFGVSPPRIGELALALARPGQTVRAALGVVSVMGGPFRSHDGTQIEHYVELDRDLPRGFSGGLLLDAAGQGLGVNLPGILRGANITLPAPTLLRVVAALEQHGRVPAGYLGVGVYPARLPRDVADDLGQERGVAIVALEENGPAAAAGLAIGDVIIAVQRDSITSPIALRSALADQSGKTINLKVLRASKTEDLTVSVGERG